MPQKGSAHSAPARERRGALRIPASDRAGVWGRAPREKGSRMSLLKRWLQQPQRVWLRRALFQVHLWTGLALGVYVVVLSVTGSALVYRAELVALFRTPVP